MAVELSDLGMSVAELQERVIENIADRMLSRLSCVDEEGETSVPSSLKAALNKFVMERIDAGLKRLADEVVLPDVDQRIEGLVLQHTNQWGEKKGEPVTFVEYLVERAQQYMVEKVNYNGYDAAECRSRSDSFTPHTTRIVKLVEKHIQYRLDEAVKTVIANGNQTLAKGIEEAVKISVVKAISEIKVQTVVK